MISTVETPVIREVVYLCGPVRLALAFEDASLQEALHGLLSQYDAPWPETKPTIHVKIVSKEIPVECPPNAGSYLTMNRLKVDRHGLLLRSYGIFGSFMEYDLAAGEARIDVPDYPDRLSMVEEVEQHFILLLARAWALAGWTPLHGGTLIPPEGERAVFLCAPSGVGKTTLTAAMLRRDWKTLGDDKTLLRIEGNKVIARSLAHRFHLHPNSSRWFPEAGDITAWPTYSRWTDKRVVRIEKLWPGRLTDRAIPGAVVQLERNENGPALTIQPLDQTGVLNTFLRQVAIPSDAEHARPLVSCIARMAGNIRGAIFQVGTDAFNDASTTERIEIEFRKLLA
ncbi:MAG TPA: hypothetical protein VH255_08120 [Verrucomicrobiae bacterium]|nr:hypothetical protein [Verrucomicrobiae bacterium]